MIITYSNGKETLITTKEDEQTAIQSDDWFGPYSSRFLEDYERKEWGGPMFQITAMFGVISINGQDINSITS